jgi:hypothetical protein
LRLKVDTGNGCPIIATQAINSGVLIMFIEFNVGDYDFEVNVFNDNITKIVKLDTETNEYLPAIEGTDLSLPDDVDEHEFQDVYQQEKTDFIKWYNQD